MFISVYCLKNDQDDILNEKFHNNAKKSYTRNLARIKYGLIKVPFNFKENLNIRRKPRTKTDELLKEIIEELNIKKDGINLELVPEKITKISLRKSRSRKKSQTINSKKNINGIYDDINEDGDIILISHKNRWGNSKRRLRSLSDTRRRRNRWNRRCSSRSCFRSRTSSIKRWRRRNRETSSTRRFRTPSRRRY